MTYLAIVCMHEYSLKRHLPINANQLLYKKSAGRQFIILELEQLLWARKLAKTLTKNGCHVTVEDSYITARSKIEKALKFHRLEIETGDEHESASYISRT